MRTDPNVRHRHTETGTTTSYSAAHSHALAEAEAALAVETAARLSGDAANAAALADLGARLSNLEAVVASLVPAPPPPLTRINVGKGQKGIVVSEDGQLIENLEIVGPGFLTYDAATFGIWSAAAVQGVVIRNCIIRGMGHSGMWLGNLTDLRIEDCIVEDVAYSGITLLGALRAEVLRSTVRRVGNDGLSTVRNNAYGLYASHIGAQRRSEDVLFRDCIAEDVPMWHGLDTHGGLRVAFVHNIVRRCPRGVFLTSNDNGAVAEDCLVQDNLFAEPVEVAGGTNKVWATTYKAQGAIFRGNVVDPAYGAPLVWDYMRLSTGTVQEGNTSGTVLP